MPESSPATPDRRDVRLIAGVVLLAGSLVVLGDGLFRHGLFDQKLWSPAGYRALAAVFVFTFSLGFFTSVYFSRFWICVVSLSLIIYAGVLAGVGSLAAVVLILLAALGLGDGLFEWLRLHKINSYSENITIALKTSAGLALLVALVQVAVHWPVNFPAVYIAAIALILVWRRRAIGSLLKGYAGQVEWSRDSGNPFVLACSSGLLLFAMLLHVIVACKPEVGADALSLHLWIPTYVQTHHFWHFDALQSVASLTPKAASLSFTLVYLLEGEMAARLLNLSFLVLTGWMVYEALLPKIGRTLSNLLLAAYLSTPFLGLVSGSLFQEHFWTLMILSAAVMAVAETDSFSGRWALVGLFLALALATKAPTLFVLPVLIGLFFWQVNREGRKWQETGWAFAICFLMIGLIGGWPYGIAWLKTGNPVFPYMNEVFQSPYYFTDNDFSGQARRMFPQGVSPTLLYDLTFHSDISLEGLKGSAGFLWLTFLLPALAFLKKETAPLVKLGLIAGVVLIAGEFSNFVYLRYVIPALPFFILLIGAYFIEIKNHTGAKIFSGVALAVVILLNGIFFGTAGWQHKNLVDFDFDRYVQSKAPERFFNEYMNTFHPGEPVLFVGRFFPAGLRSPATGENWYFPKNATQLRWEAKAGDLLEFLESQGIRFVIASDKAIEKRPFIKEPIDRNFDKILTVNGNFLAKVRQQETFTEELLLNPDFTSGLKKWGHSKEVQVDKAGVRATKQNTLTQGVRVSPNERFRVAYHVNCPKPAIMRVQVNWLDEQGKRAGVSLISRPCSGKELEISEVITAPENATQGVFYVGAHDERPVWVSSVSMKR